MPAVNGIVFDAGTRFCKLTLLPQVTDVDWGDIERLGTDVVEQLKSERSGDLLVDLSKIEYIASAHVALLVRVWKSVKPRNGRMVVFVVSDVVERVLHTAGLDKLWKIVNTLEEAEHVVSGNAPVSDAMPREDWRVAVTTILTLSGLSFGLLPHGPPWRVQLALGLCALSGVASLLFWLASRRSMRWAYLVLLLVNVVVIAALGWRMVVGGPGL